MKFTNNHLYDVECLYAYVFICLNLLLCLLEIYNFPYKDIFFYTHFLSLSLVFSPIANILLAFT